MKYKIFLIGLATALLAQPLAAFTKLDVSRVLLMNDDTNTTWEVLGQGYFSTNKADEVYWTHSDEAVPNATSSDALWKLNLLPGVSHTLHWTMPGDDTPTPLWQLNKCRAGSAATRSSTSPATSVAASGAKRNFIPWSGAHSVAISDGTSMSATASFLVAGMVSMLNSTNSWVMSPLYDNIGTIYFDAINGWTDKPGSIVVEIATNTVDGSELTAGTAVGKLNWCAIPFNVLTVEDKTSVKSAAERVMSFNLNQDKNETTRLWGKYFYRIRATLNYRYAPIRFRIRRDSVDTTTTNEEELNKGNYLILDNIVASYAPIQIDFGPFKGINGERSYDATRIGSSVVGYEGVTSKIYPYVGQSGVRPISYFAIKENPYVTNTVASDFTIVNPKFHCRWRYLEQITNNWKTVDLKILSSSINTQYISTASSPPEINEELSNGPGDLEFYYTLDLTKQPYFEPFDFACDLPATSAFGAGWKELVNPMKLTFRCGEQEADELGIMRRTKGRDYFVRIREGESTFRDVELDLSIGEPGNDDGRELKNLPMALVGDHTWRAYFQMPTNQVGKSVRIRLHAVESSQKGGVFSDTNTYWCSVFTTNTIPPCNAVMAECSFSDPDSIWGETLIDCISGYLMLEYNDQTHSLSATHCEYQNFNLWTDASKGGYVGHSVDCTNSAMAGVSADKKAFVETFRYWEQMPSNSTYWTEHFVVNNGDSGFPTNEWLVTHRTPNGWSFDNGMFLAESYNPKAVDISKTGLSLQLQGLGKGNLSYVDKAPMPIGLGTVAFAARAAQYQDSEDFAFYQDGLSFKDYAVGARVNFTSKGRDERDIPQNGQPSISLIGYYRDRVGCYEYRLTRIPEIGIDMALYRWRKPSRGSMSCTLLTNRVIKTDHLIPSTAASNSKDWTATYLALYSDNVSKKTYITAALAGDANTKSMKDNEAALTNLITFVDSDSALRCEKGSFGVSSKDCPANFGNIGMYSLNTNPLDARGNVSPDLNISPDITELVEEENWSLPDGRIMLIDNVQWTYCLHACEPEQKVRLMLSPVGRGSDWFDSGYAVSVTSFVFNAYSFSPRLVDSYNVRLCTGEGEADDDVRVDIVLDDVEISQWNTTSWNDWSYNGYTNWVYSQCWIGDIATYSVPDACTYAQIGTSDEFEFTFTKSCTMTPLVDLEVSHLYIVSGNGRLKEVDAITLGSNRSVKTGVPIKVDVGANASSYSRVTFGTASGNYYTANTGDSTVAPDGEKSLVVIRLRVGGKIAKMHPRRGKPAEPMMIRSPFLNGLSLFSFSYQDADPDAVLHLQIATNDVGEAGWAALSRSLADPGWVTVTNYTFRTMPKSGVCTTHLGLREPVRGFLRLLCDTNVVQNAYTTDAYDYYSTTNYEYGSVIIKKVIAYDEPMLDERSWYGWNMRTSKDPALAYLPDPADDPEGLAGALNFTGQDEPGADFADIGFLDAEGYDENDPFFQSPAISNYAGIGQVQFRARMMDPGSSWPSYVSVYGSPVYQVMDPKDEDWTLLDEFMVTNRTYHTFQWKTFEDVTPYKTIRLAVRGAKDGRYSINAATNPVQRVLIDEIAVTEPISPGITFTSIRPFRTDLNQTLAELTPIANAESMEQQPLLGEAFGIQVEADLAQLPEALNTKSIKVYMSYYVGEEPWGYENWQDSAAAVTGCELARCGGPDSTELVWRSTYGSGYAASIIPPQIDMDGAGRGVVVQYHVWAEYLDTMGTNHVHNVKSGEWRNPRWYYPIDLNAENGGYSDAGRFCPYTILQTISPKRSWINCLNIYDGDHMNHGTNQFIELAVPSGIDMYGWTLRLTEHDGEFGVTQPFAVLGEGINSSRKSPSYNYYSFLTLQSPAASAVKRWGDGLDGTWYPFPTRDDSRANGAFSPVNPYGVELVRPNGIVEHQIVFAGTNLWEEINPRYGSNLNPVVVLEKFKKLDAASQWVCAGSDTTDGTIGVMRRHGAETDDWEVDLSPTPTNRNKRRSGTYYQDIPANWLILPAGTNYWVYSYIYGDHISQEAGEENGSVISIVLPKGSSTNITYTVDPWHRIGTFTSNDVSVAVPPYNAGTRTYKCEISNISTNIKLEATACVAPTIDELIPASDPYHDAVVRWLENFGEESEIIPAELKRRGHEDDPADNTHISLKEMYWLNIYPFQTNRFVVGFSKAALPHPVPEDMIDLTTPHPALTNIRMSVYMAITNIDSRGDGKAYAPYTLQGLGGESSTNYTAASPNWTSATFKVMGWLKKEKQKNWRPLRYFVFNEDSFKEDFTADIEIWDPFSSKTPIYSDLDVLWWPYRDETIWYSFRIDDESHPIRIYPLKSTDYLTP